MVSEVNNLNNDPNAGAGFISGLGTDDDASASDLSDLRQSLESVRSQASGSSNLTSSQTTIRRQDRRYSYGNRLAQGQATVQDNAESQANNTSSQATIRAQDRRYSYGNRLAQGQATVQDNADSQANNTSSQATIRAQDRRYSYGNRLAQGQATVQDNADSQANNTSSQTTIRSQDSRYSFTNRLAQGQARDQSNTGGTNSSSTVRAPNRRYSFYNGERAVAEQRPQDDGVTQAPTNAARTGSVTAKNTARARRLLAQSEMFSNAGNGWYSYNDSERREFLTTEEAQDALFYSDVARQMMGNGFTITQSQYKTINNYNFEFSDEFKEFNNTPSDLLYQQAAYVDALIENGATLTTEQETLLGIGDDPNADPDTDNTTGS